MDSGAALAEWPFEPLLWALLALSLAVYLRAARARGWSLRRTLSFTAGVMAVAIALCSPVAVYAEGLLSVHMVQHLLLTQVAAPLLVMGAPAALALRAAPIGARTRIATVVRSRSVRALSHPISAWLLFAGVMWASHFSVLYDRALDNPLLHVFEHGLYLGAALLFWWPLVGLDPGAHRLPKAGRVGYLLLAIPVQSFLGLAIYSSSEILYPHYGSLVRSWGPDALADQRLGGAIMWLGGDALFLVAFMVLAWVWLGSEEHEQQRMDRRLGLH
ncbi:MAG: cytochrome c oxidase assembly protein [Actinomycetota bacterium]|nr:cytochrome c oxidase assembly protein [Actinomycetota bacterium]